ncbi:3-oxoacyl-[acyl-carrier-protein] synthase 3 [Odoribacter laneus YIT 12061]|uniref:3-oxoacyl-[acyl-carrier-protein] synthase 3 n=1 Tax=Odoribacter laneus YIT 12061 TaxID=742817 RepID=H1DLE0_9BACT|nr:3-oxoacyl-[acyl-carrier-protein] synthase 3 [Odoribacter laneus YIT 12061]
MSFLSIKNVKIRGIAACVPSRIEENKDYKELSAEEIEKYIQTTGVQRRHCAIHDGSICTSDLCQKAAEKLISDLKWDKSEIGLLVFVSHTTDYRLPATACVLQDKMGITKNCLAFDVTLGCSGYLLGMGIAGSLLQNGTIKKALVMVGNTQSEYASYHDRSMYLLLGDAGTVTALEYNEQDYDEMDFNYLTDGSGRASVIVPDGGSRNPVNEKSFIQEDYGDGIKRNRLQEKMDGTEVFSFAIHHVPQNFKELMDQIHLNKEDVDYLLIHQANKFLCEKLRKKIGFPPEKCPYNIQEFGNTSGATIPLLMVTNLKKELESKPLTICMTTIGVGFSLGSGCIKTNKIVCPDLMYL